LGGWCCKVKAVRLLAPATKVNGNLSMNHQQPRCRVLVKAAAAAAWALTGRALRGIRATSAAVTAVGVTMVITASMHGRSLRELQWGPVRGWPPVEGRRKKERERGDAAQWQQQDQTMTPRSTAGEGVCPLPGLQQRSQAKATHPVLVQDFRDGGNPARLADWDAAELGEEWPQRHGATHPAPRRRRVRDDAARCHGVV